jgi:hypothetical protein
MKRAHLLQSMKGAAREALGLVVSWGAGREAALVQLCHQKVAESGVRKIKFESYLCHL